MRLSGYIKIFPCRDDPSRFLLFSTRTFAKLLVPRTLFEALDEGTLSDMERDTLADNGFLVHDKDTERHEMMSAIDEANRRSSRAVLTVVINLDCNLSCAYCYEGGQRGRHYMTSETMELLACFAEEKYLSRGKDLLIDFYGGEPLLSAGQIGDISRKLKSLAEREGRHYEFTLVTNGTLLTRAVISQLVPLGLKSARITLDGPRDNHDSYRPFVSGEGSFNVIIQNLADVSDLIGIGIGGNYTRDNYRSFPQLLDTLIARGLTPERISHVMFSPVTEALGRHLSPEFSEGCVSTDEPWLLEASVFLREEILRRGFFTPRVSPTICMIELQDNLVVNFDGTIYKCPAFIGCQDLEAGHLKSGFTDYGRTHNLAVWKKDECGDCAYLPLCFGGCRFLRLIRTGAIDDVECRRSYFDAVLEEFVLQDIRYLRKKNL